MIGKIQKLICKSNLDLERGDRDRPGSSRVNAAESASLRKIWKCLKLVLGRSTGVGKQRHRRNHSYRRQLHFNGKSEWELI
jgi:hypothetical protein